VASTTLPLLLFALPAGALADLRDRRAQLVIAQLVMAVAALGMAVLDWSGTATPLRLLTLGLLLGAGFAFNLPAWQSFIPDLVPRELLPQAVALNSASFNVARAVGPAIGGALVAAAGAGWAFAINAVSYLVIVGALVAARPTPGVPSQPETGGGEGSLAQAIRDGLRFTRFSPQVQWLLLVAAAFALSTAVVQATLPNFTADALGGDALTYGLLLGCMGAGALLAAFTRPRVAQRLGRRMVPFAIILFGVAGVFVGLSRSAWQAALGMVVVGLGWVWTLSTLNATTQLLAPRWVRGRVMSLYTLAFLGFVPLGAILAGVLGDTIGVPQAFVVLSSVAIVLGLVTTRLPLPVLGEVAARETLDPVAPAELRPHPTEVRGGPITVMSTYQIADEDLEPFLDVMGQLRLVRLRTGAHRWRLYRDVGDPHRMTELYVLPTWEQHLSQLSRLDRVSLDLIRHARTFDRSGNEDGPHVAHLAAIDVTSRPSWEDLSALRDAQGVV
jgi:MFS family permease